MIESTISSAFDRVKLFALHDVKSARCLRPYLMEWAVLYLENECTSASPRLVVDVKPRYSLYSDIIHY